MLTFILKCGHKGKALTCVKPPMKIVIIVNDYFYVTRELTVTGLTIIYALDFVLHDLLLPVSFLALSNPIICRYFIRCFSFRCLF